MHKTTCKPAGPDHLTDNPGEHLQGHQNYISKVAIEILMAASESLTDVCYDVKNFCGCKASKKSEPVSSQVTLCNLSLIPR